MSFLIEGAREFIPDIDAFQGLREAAMILPIDRVTAMGPLVVRSVTAHYEIVPGRVIRRRKDRAGYDERKEQRYGELPPRVRGRTYPTSISLASSLGFR